MAYIGSSGIGSIELRYTVSSGGTFGQPVVVDSADDTGLYSVLLLDSNDVPSIVYWDRTTTRIRIAQRSSRTLR